MSTPGLPLPFVMAIKSICLLLSALWLSLPAFGATPNPQRVGEVRGVEILYVAESEFAMIDEIKEGTASVYRYNMTAIELSTFTVSGKSTRGLVLTQIISVGDYLIGQYGQVDPFGPPQTTSELSIWSRSGAFVTNVSLPDGQSVEERQFAVDGTSLVVRRSNSTKEPLERFDLVTLVDGKSTLLMTFPTRSSIFSFGNGIVSIVRDELEPNGLIPFVHNYGLDGKRIASVNLGKLIPNGSDGLGTQALLIEPDPKAKSVLEFYLAWDFLRKIVTLDRLTLRLNSEGSTLLRSDQISGSLLRRGDQIVSNFSVSGSPGEDVRALYINGQKIEVNNTFESGKVFINPDFIALNAVRRCVVTANDGLRDVCVRLGSPTIYRYELRGDYAPSITLSSPRGSGPLFGFSENSGSRIVTYGPDVQLITTGDVEVPLTFANVGNAPEISTVSSSFADDNYCGFVTNRWRYDSVKRVLTAPALSPCKTEYISVKVKVGSTEWSFDRLKVIYYSSNQTTANTPPFYNTNIGSIFVPSTGSIPLVEFFNTNLGHFFITLEGPESKSIDEGRAGLGWIRTGYSWGAWTDAALAPRQAKGVCRFYGNPALDVNGKRLGPNSHFYTIDPDECARVAKDPGWILESKTAFYAIAPNRNQRCVPTQEVRRWYNKGFPAKDSNHRYSSSGGDTMQRTKWSDEGVQFCLPNAN
jgi:hypothetical protein